MSDQIQVNDVVALMKAMSQIKTEDLTRSYLSEIVKGQNILNYKGGLTAYMDALQVAQALDRVNSVGGDNSIGGILDTIKQNITPYPGGNTIVNTQYPTTPAPAPAPTTTSTFQKVLMGLLVAAGIGGPLAGLYIANQNQTQNQTQTQTQPQSQSQSGEVEVF